MAEQAPRSPKPPFYERHFGAIMTTLISVATVAFSVFQFSMELRVERREKELAVARANREYDMKTYEYVINSIITKDTLVQKATLSLIPLVNDEGIRSGLRGALIRGGEEEVSRETDRQDAAERRFAVEQQTVFTPAEKASWRYDVFYCEESGAQGESEARKIAAVLQKGEGVVRLRPLPASVNLRPGYRVRGYQIRYENSETGEMEKLRESLSAFAMRPMPVSNNTPNYLSIFACP